MSKQFNPHSYQAYSIQQMIDTPYIGAFLDMGLGKTVITLTALHSLKYYRFCIRKTLIIAPKKVAENTWTKERDKWDHLKNLRISVVLGSAKERRAAKTQNGWWICTSMTGRLMWWYWMSPVLLKTISHRDLKH